MSYAMNRVMLDALNVSVFEHARKRDRVLWELGAVRAFRDAVLRGEDATAACDVVNERVRVLAATEKRSNG